MIEIDEPGLVVDAVRRVHAAARNKAKLLMTELHRSCLLFDPKGCHVMVVHSANRKLAGTGFPDFACHFKPKQLELALVLGAPP